MQRCSRRLRDASPNESAESGPVNKIYAYAWTALRNATATWFRRSANKVAERALSPEHSEAVLGTLETSVGTPEQIEQRSCSGR